MKISEEARRYLVPPKQIGGFLSDESDVKLAEIMRPWQDMEEIDVALLGVPYDTSVMYRPGCRFGPDSIRDAMAFSNIYEPGLESDLNGLRITDFGNVDVDHTNVEKTHDRVEQVVTEIVKTGATPLILGGDHSLSYPNVRGLLNNLDGNVGIIMFDGHLDVRTDHHGMVSSGTPFRRLIDEDDRNPLQPKNLVEVGINGWLSSKHYHDYCKEQGITVIPARDVHRRGIHDVIAEAIEIASQDVDALWISFDIDALDLAYAPGTCAPNPGGMTTYQALEAIWEVGQHPLCRGMDILEVSPPWDLKNMTSLTAAALCMNFIGATKERIHGSGS